MPTIHASDLRVITLTHAECRFIITCLESDQSLEYRDEINNSDPDEVMANTIIIELGGTDRTNNSPPVEEDEYDEDYCSDCDCSPCTCTCDQCGDHPCTCEW